MCQLYTMTFPLCKADYTQPYAVGRITTDGSS